MSIIDVGGVLVKDVLWYNLGKGVIFMAKRPKRANGEGSLFQNENKVWICQIMVGYRPDGKRI